MQHFHSDVVTSHSISTDYKQCLGHGDYQCPVQINDFPFSLNVSLVLLITIKLNFRKIHACQLALLNLFLVGRYSYKPAFCHGQINNFCSAILALC